MFEITKHGFTLFALSFLFTGINIFASALFAVFFKWKNIGCFVFFKNFCVFSGMSFGVAGYVGSRWDMDGCADCGNVY